MAKKNVNVVTAIDEYLAKSHPSDNDWEGVKFRISDVVIDVKRLLGDLRIERSDFVMEKAYLTLVQTLGQREHILLQFQSLPRPATSAERQALREINRRYKLLLENFQEAIGKLNEYLKLTRTS